MGQGPPGQQFRAGEKGGAGVGKTEIGQGSNVMAVADGQSLPIGLYVDSARPHESQLAAAPLATGRVPQPRVRPRTCPTVLVADNAYGSRDWRQRLRRRGIKLTLPTVERRQRRKPIAAPEHHHGFTCMVVDGAQGVAHHASRWRPSAR